MSTCRHVDMYACQQNGGVRSDCIHPCGSAINLFTLYVNHKDRHTQSIKGGAA
jgi:hypothetical protein